jgi:hypothetical protein
MALRDFIFFGTTMIDRIWLSSERGRQGRVVLDAPLTTRRVLQVRGGLRTAPPYLQIYGECSLH